MEGGKKFTLINVKIILIFFPVLASVMCAFSLYGQSVDGARGEPAYAFTVEPSFGFLWGRGEEIVYAENPTPVMNQYTSQLLWDIKPLVYFGVEAEYGPRHPWETHGVHAELSLKYGLPLKTGVLEDRDWLSSKGSFLTNFSVHDAYSRSSPADLFAGYGSFAARLGAGYSWGIGNRFWLRVYGDVSYTRFSWTAQDGYTQYSPSREEPWNAGLPKESYSGGAVAYRQNWIIAGPGITVGARFLDRVSASLSGTITPLVYGECLDQHLARNEARFWDYPSGGLYIRAGGEIRYAMTNRISVGISPEMVSLKGARGDTHQYEGGRKTIYKNSAGGGFSYWDITLSVKYAF